MEWGWVLQTNYKKKRNKSWAENQNKTNIHKKPEMDKKKRHYDKLEREVRSRMLTQSEKHYICDQPQGMSCWLGKLKGSVRTLRTKEEGGNQKWGKLSSFALEMATRNNSLHSQRKSEDKIVEDILQYRKGGLSWISRCLYVKIENIGLLTPIFRIQYWYFLIWKKIYFYFFLRERHQCERYSNRLPPSQTPTGDGISKAGKRHH